MDAPEQYLHHPMNILSLGGHAQNLRTCSAIIIAAIASVTRQLDECLLRQKRSFAQIRETTRKLGNSAKAFPSERVGPATTWLSRECIHRKSVNLPNKNDRAPTKFIVNNLSTVKEVCTIDSHIIMEQRVGGDAGISVMPINRHAVGDVAGWEITSTNPQKPW